MRAGRLRRWVGCVHGVHIDHRDADGSDWRRGGSLRLHRRAQGQRHGSEFCRPRNQRTRSDSHRFQFYILIHSKFIKVFSDNSSF